MACRLSSEHISVFGKCLRLILMLNGSDGRWTERMAALVGFNADDAFTVVVAKGCCEPLCEFIACRFIDAAVALDTVIATDSPFLYCDGFCLTELMCQIYGVRLLRRCR